MRRRSYGYQKRYRGFFLIIGVLLLLFCFLEVGNHRALEKVIAKGTSAPQEIVLEEGESMVVPPQEISLLHCETGAYERMDMETYIIRVLAGEVPPSFEPEAIKAQAIVARTYALAKLDQGGELCDFYGHCQSYYSDEALKERWGSNYDAYYEKYRQCVEETKGQGIFYQGHLAKTYFHSACGGKTSSSKEVWGGDLPYLQSVSCSWDKDAPRYEETITIPLEKAASLLESNGTEVGIPKIEGATESGRVAAVSFDGNVMAATDFRKKLSLNSTNFTLEEKDHQLVITTRGYGHGVGLCQHGANGMAKEGYKAAEIIHHYYQDITIETMP